MVTPVTLITFFIHMSSQDSNKKLLPEIRDIMRRLHYSIHTERIYCDWITRYIRFHHMQVKLCLLNRKNRLKTI